MVDRVSRAVGLGGADAAKSAKPKEKPAVTKVAAKPKPKPATTQTAAAQPKAKPQTQEANAAPPAPSSADASLLRGAQPAGSSGGFENRFGPWQGR